MNHAKLLLKGQRIQVWSWKWAEHVILKIPNQFGFVSFSALFFLFIFCGNETGKKTSGIFWIALDLSFSVPRHCLTACAAYTSSHQSAWTSYVFLTNVSSTTSADTKPFPSSYASPLPVKPCKFRFELWGCFAASSGQSEAKHCGRNLHKSAWLIYWANGRSDRVTSPFLGDNTMQQLTFS